jgi:hypothetical protein
MEYQPFDFIFFFFSFYFWNLILSKIKRKEETKIEKKALACLRTEGFREGGVGTNSFYDARVFFSFLIINLLFTLIM